MIELAPIKKVCEGGGARWEIETTLARTVKQQCTARQVERCCLL
jgi:hypothetical protein